MILMKFVNGFLLKCVDSIRVEIKFENGRFENRVEDRGLFDNFQPHVTRIVGFLWLF